MNRRDFLGSMALAPAALAAQNAKPRRPNFLIILADDMGYSDARCYGGDIETPNIEQQEEKPRDSAARGSARSRFFMTDWV